MDVDIQSTMTGEHHTDINIIIQFSLSLSPSFLHVPRGVLGRSWAFSTLIIIIMYIYHALINALSVHIIHINLNMIFYTHVEHSPTKTIYIKYYTKTKQKNAI